VDAAGNVSRPVALLPALPLAQLPPLQERPLMRFQLDPLEGAAAYRGEIGLTPGFATPLAEVVSTSPELRFQGLADGDYVLRARARGARPGPRRARRGAFVPVEGATRTAYPLDASPGHQTAWRIGRIHLGREPRGRPLPVAARAGRRIRVDRERCSRRERSR